MSYGSQLTEPWVNFVFQSNCPSHSDHHCPKYLPEEEGIKHIKAAYDAGIQTFDTANVYSNGLSEIILGKAIKLHKLPRDEIVVMTKVTCVGSQDIIIS
jgi:aryl-alcohol dehydrogenase-like predicted oxidoreductase